MNDSQKDILNFWFEESQPQQWFQKNPAFDELIRSRFLEVYEIARQGALNDWKNDGDGVLSLCILLDQFPRNMFRGSAQSFATDAQALLIAKYALSKGLDQVVSPAKRRFVYLPFEHSEHLQDQRKSVELFETMKATDPLGHEYALRHLEIVEKYGRFPHRNNILGRENTPEEEIYMSQVGSGF
ncbi:MAG: DUF924 domain-containing protein [Alphaproteobacteria bacterium]|nr:DUF924 domain-containing protein [Alphaproteobacteria bacterium]